MYPDSENQFVSKTDASLQSLGAALSQKDEKERPHPFQFESRTLNSASKRCCFSEKEPLAIDSSLKMFRVYLLSLRKLVLITDYQ